MVGHDAGGVDGIDMELKVAGVQNQPKSQQIRLAVYKR
jgi:hypothetical protein